ncbi:nad-dependent epimerase dehydratase [Colletotrichum karsti]|uniref:Nad-dependent epimerase dehydratase n=1 Tax=Colletotrichum karsti TaxID=1095194 RepID=A0A9P6HUU4_9PEZI|nr:nad-dependent epimerase dehydratase [Colletotrichum karsti]KAF9871188.1 nad-dependent epimerase dehydratase [Colletotrichum karsti]
MSCLKVGVIGATGMTGSHATVELLNRGHSVIGVCRDPSRLGKHERYEPRSIDLSNSDVLEIAKRLHGLDVVVNAYGPHSQLGSAFAYRSFVEMTRKILLASREAKVPYFVMVGGAGSLEVPDRPCMTAADDARFFSAYGRAMLASEAFITHCQNWSGDFATRLRAAREAWVAERSGNGTDETKKVLDDLDKTMADMNSQGVDFITGARATYMFFDGNTSFKWTYISPPPLYRPGTRTGSYRVELDRMPLQLARAAEGGNNLSIFEGRLQSISVPDMAVAIADEIEQQTKVWKHWCPFTEGLDDEPGPTYVTISEGS